MNRRSNFTRILSFCLVCYGSIFFLDEAAIAFDCTNLKIIADTAEVGVPEVEGVSASQFRRTFNVFIKNKGTERSSGDCSLRSETSGQNITKLPVIEGGRTWNQQIVISNTSARGTYSFYIFGPGIDTLSRWNYMMTLSLMAPVTTNPGVNSVSAGRPHTGSSASSGTNSTAPSGSVITSPVAHAVSDCAGLRIESSSRELAPPRRSSADPNRIERSFSFVIRNIGAVASPGFGCELKSQQDPGRNLAQIPSILPSQTYTFLSQIQVVTQSFASSSQFYIEGPGATLGSSPNGSFSVNLLSLPSTSASAAAPDCAGLRIDSSSREILPSRRSSIDPNRIERSFNIAVRNISRSVSPSTGCVLKMHNESERVVSTLPAIQPSELYKLPQPILERTLPKAEVVEFSIDGSGIAYASRSNFLSMVRESHMRRDRIFFTH